ncbi:unnamed protein product [Rhodiola kirilowii]
MTIDTTDLSYWLNWRFFICVCYVVIVIVGASFVIWKYEGSGSSNSKSRRKKSDNQLPGGYLHKDEMWKTSRTVIHPAWLLVYRLCAFIGLLAILITNISVEGFRALYFYTQWTFALVTLYFGVGSAISIYGCRKNCSRLIRDQIGYVPSNAEKRSAYDAVPQDADANVSSIEKDDDLLKVSCDQSAADFLGYSFQAIFQVAAGASMLSDSVFWCLIYPFILPESFHLHFLVVSMHSFNALFLIGDAFLNCLRFPFFRIAYFALWTIIYVIFQWIIHACFSMWWPYPFLDLSSPYAPAWYLAIGLIMLPCFGIFALIMKLKDFLLSKFPESE